MESFSNITKRELLDVQKNKKCCVFASIYAFVYLSTLIQDTFVLKKTNAENGNFVINRISSVLKKPIAEYIPKNRELLINKGFSRFSTFAEIKSGAFKCDDCIGEFFKSLFLICGTITNPLKDYRLELVFDDEPVNVFSHYKELEQIGLAAPEIVYIMNELRERGMDIKSFPLTEKEGLEGIIDALRRKGSY